MSQPNTSRFGIDTDIVVRQWHREHPELDCRVMAVYGDIWRASEYLKKGVTALAAKYKLDYPRFDVLMTLRRQGQGAEVSPSELAKQAMLSTSAMTNRLDRLEKDGLITRTHDSTDRRGVKIALSQAGFDLIESLLVEHLANEERMLAALDQDERDQLRALLRKIV